MKNKAVHQQQGLFAAESCVALLDSWMGTRPEGQTFTGAGQKFPLNPLLLQVLWQVPNDV